MFRINPAVLHGSGTTALSTQIWQQAKVDERRG